MKIVRIYKGKESVLEREAVEILIGRPRQNLRVDLDLSPDLGVSRPHARIWHEGGECWIEDLNSANGTTVEGEAIKGRGKQRLKPGHKIQISETVLTLEAEPPRPERDPSEDTANRLDIRSILDASEPAFVAGGRDADGAQRLALLYELPLLLGSGAGLDAALQLLTERVVNVIPRATRGALLLRDPVSNSLLLKGSVPRGRPAISETLVARALEERKGFVWHRGPDLTLSQGEFNIEAGIYVPLLWKDEVLGVLCVDNNQGGPDFGEDDLRLLVAAAQHAAIAAIQARLQDDLRQNSTLLGRLLTNFSPKVREQLLTRARRGRLRLGGEKSEMAIMMADIRGFTALTAEMETDEVVDLLNEYLSALVETIFKFDGTVDKYDGDSILAVFGSPEPDPQMYEKSVRAAVAMQESAAQVGARRAARSQVICEFGIGVHCGEVLHGFIGSQERMQFTVTGTAVNHTERYCSGAAGGEILLSQQLWQRTYRLVDTEMVEIPTKHEGAFQAFRVKGLRTTGKL